MIAHPRPRVLITDDESDVRWTLSALLRTRGFEPLEADNGSSALQVLQQEPVDTLLLDLRMPGPNGLEILREVKRLNTLLPVILISGQGSISVAVEAMKSGATGFLTKPFRNEEVIAAIQEALQGLPLNVSTEHEIAELIGRHPVVQQAAAAVTRVAPTDFTVIVQGETGTGKELVARAIHRQSRRAAGPFVPIDCGAVTPTLIESELFGHEKGSFTGADRVHVGCFEAARGGTVLLDEIHNLPLATQAKLLRVLQEKQVRRVGAANPTKIDVRVVAVTNVDLAALVEDGRFRRDLYHRLNEFKVVLPPLRNRGNDLILLADRFIREACGELGKTIGGFSPEAVAKLQLHHWSGNVRELRNVIRRAVLLADQAIRPEHLEIEGFSKDELMSPVAQTANRLTAALSGGISLKALVREKQAATEREVVAEALRLSGGNKTRAARLLRVDCKTLRAKAKEYHLDHALKEDSHE